MALVSPEQEKLLKQQYAAARTRLGAEKTGIQGQLKEKMARQSAILGGGAGGAVLKSQRKGMEGISKAFSEAETGLSGQEAGAMQQAQSEAEAKQFAREERLGSQEFASAEAEKQRAAEESRFGRTLDFQKGSFADTMQFQWAELDENTKTNFINATIALKDAGLNNPGAWRDMFLNTPLGNLFPGKAKVVQSQGGGPIVQGIDQTNPYIPNKYKTAANPNILRRK